MTLKYYKEQKNKAGVTYGYIRYQGKFISITGPDGQNLTKDDPGFLPAYVAAREKAGATRGLRAISNSRLPEPGTFDDLIETYVESATWMSVEPKTRENKRYLHKRLCEVIGDLPVRSFGYEHAVALQAMFRDTPGLANTIVSEARNLIDWGMGQPRFRTDGINPFDKIRRMKIGEYEPWPEGLFKAVTEAAEPTLRRAYFLYLYTGQRTSDVITMQWNHVNAQGQLRVIQEKTDTELYIPFHSELLGEFERHKPESLFMVHNAWGHMWSEDAIQAQHRNLMKKLGTFEVTEPRTGIKVEKELWKPGTGCTFNLHGLRKNAVISLLEVGCTEWEVHAITGMSLDMIRHYAKMVRRKQLALNAMERYNSLAGDKVIGRIGNG